MTCKISRSVFALAFAIAMLAALSNPSHAGLSTGERTDSVAAVPAPAPAPEQTTVAAVSPQPATPAVTPAAVAAPAPAKRVAAVTPAARPRQVSAPNFTQSFAFAPRPTSGYGYPCH